MTETDYIEEIKRLYIEGYSLREATEKVLKMIEYRRLKDGNKRTSKNAGNTR
ncbi:hypothetical protein M2651_05705 [Clostridium sp. SYSU_GA19001]|uniref:hypothetical protein n=1 Tax=Clostridium caldaquaticum TaxID=2940653 RepID=UPI002076E132|nr:hypothetical protein [Clostridium caldaquaticum]MCM8710520.1 hypothetical protein [Clostridium caldaquaticum]